MRWTPNARDVRASSVRRSRVVLTPRCWRQVCGGNRRRRRQESRSPGRARSKPSTHCAGKAGMLPLNLYARVRVLCAQLHARPRVQRAPGLPCALCFRGGKRRGKPRVPCAARSRMRINRRMGGAKRYPSMPVPVSMGIASLHPSYRTTETETSHVAFAKAELHRLPSPILQGCPAVEVFSPLPLGFSCKCIKSLRRTFGLQGS